MRKFIYFFLKRPWLVFKRHLLIPFSVREFGKIWHFLKINFKNKFLDFPYIAIIETGNTCNLQCPTCPTPQEKITRKRELMSLENFKKIINRLKKSVHIVLLYNANEPLLNPDLSKMISYANQNHLYTMISTNATLLDKKKTNELYQSGLDEIILCLDGTTKQVYEEFRKGAIFEKVLENITYFCRQKKLKKHKKPFIELQFILNKLNQDQVEEIKKLAKKLGVNRLKIKSLALGEYAYSQKEIKELSEKFFPTSRKYQAKIRYKIVDHALKTKKKKNLCSAVQFQAVILVDGTMVVCCYDFNGLYPYGNILKNTFKEIWFNSKTRKIREQARQRLLPFCQKCAGVN